MARLTYRFNPNVFQSAHLFEQIIKQRRKTSTSPFVPQPSIYCCTYINIDVMKALAETLTAFTTGVLSAANNYWLLLDLALSTTQVI